MRRILGALLFPLVVVFLFFFDLVPDFSGNLRPNESVKQINGENQRQDNGQNPFPQNDEAADEQDGQDHFWERAPRAKPQRFKGGILHFADHHDGKKEQQAGQNITPRGMGKVAVGLPGWSHWKDAWIRDFVGKEVFLDLDADAAGQKGVADIAKRFQKAGLPCPLTLARPKDQKDANDLLQAFMKDGKTERMKS